MSYRITLGFSAEWAEFCFPRDGDMEMVVAVAYAEDAKVFALTPELRETFISTGKNFIGHDLSDYVRLAERDRE